MGVRISFLDESGLQKLERIEGLNELEQDLRHQLPDASFITDRYGELTIVHPTSRTPDGKLKHYGGNVIRYDVRVDPRSRSIFVDVDPTGVTIDENCKSEELRALREELLIINSINLKLGDALWYFANDHGFWYNSPFNRERSNRDGYNATG